MLTGKVFILLYIDLDRFKAYNDYFGYKKGDEIIQLTADILTDRLENGGFIGHIGGDDYIVILNHYGFHDFCETVTFNCHRYKSKEILYEYRRNC